MNVTVAPSELACRVDGPQIVLARPAAARDAMAVANVRPDAVLFDHFAHVLENLFGACDRRSDPRLEAIAERVEVGVGTHAGVLVRFPRAAEGILHLEDHVASCSGTAAAGGTPNRCRKCPLRRSRRRRESCCLLWIEFSPLPRLSLLIDGRLPSNCRDSRGERQLGIPEESGSGTAGPYQRRGFAGLEDVDFRRGTSLDCRRRRSLRITCITTTRSPSTR